MDRTTLVHTLDKFVSNSKDAKFCPKHKPKDPNGYHGKLWPTATGDMLVCGTCGYAEQVDNGLLALAVNFADAEVRRPMGGMLDARMADLKTPSELLR